jgi:hypothetical protein
MGHEPGIWLAVPMIAGQDDRVEVAEQADPVQLAACAGALRIGDHRARLASG